MTRMGRPGSALIHQPLRTRPAPPNRPSQCRTPGRLCRPRCTRSSRAAPAKGERIEPVAAAKQPDDAAHTRRERQAAEHPRASRQSPCRVGRDSHADQRRSGCHRDRRAASAIRGMRSGERPRALTPGHRNFGLGTNPMSAGSSLPGSERVALATRISALELFMTKLVAIAPPGQRPDLPSEPADRRPRASTRWPSAGSRCCSMSAMGGRDLQGVRCTTRNSFRTCKDRLRLGTIKVARQLVGVARQLVGGERCAAGAEWWGAECVGRAGALRLGHPWRRASESASRLNLPQGFLPGGG